MSEAPPDSYEITHEFMRNNPGYVSPRGRREQGQKEAGNPAGRQAEQERISREDALYRGGFPVAGH